MIYEPHIPELLARFWPKDPPAELAAVQVRELGERGQPSKRWRLVAVDKDDYLIWRCAERFDRPTAPLGMSTRLRSEDEALNLGHYLRNKPEIFSGAPQGFSGFRLPGPNLARRSDHALLGRRSGDDARRMGGAVSIVRSAEAGRAQRLSVLRNDAPDRARSTGDMTMEQEDASAPETVAPGLDTGKLLAKWKEERAKETRTDGDEIECPSCRMFFGDLFEYGNGDEGDHHIECPHCDAPIVLVRIIEWSYTARPRTEEDDV